MVQFHSTSMWKLFHKTSLYLSMVSQDQGDHMSWTNRDSPGFCSPVPIRWSKVLEWSPMGMHSGMMLQEDGRQAPLVLCGIKTDRPEQAPPRPHEACPGSCSYALAGMSSACPTTCLVHFSTPCPTGLHSRTFGQPAGTGLQKLELSQFAQGSPYIGLNFSLNEPL